MQRCARGRTTAVTASPIGIPKSAQRLIVVVVCAVDGCQHDGFGVAAQRVLQQPRQPGRGRDGESGGTGGPRLLQARCSGAVTEPPGALTWSRGTGCAWICPPRGPISRYPARSGTAHHDGARAINQPRHDRCEALRRPAECPQQRRRRTMLILMPSFIRFPSAPVLLIRSLPARSTRFSLPRVMHSRPSLQDAEGDV